MDLSKDGRGSDPESKLGLCPIEVLSSGKWFQRVRFEARAVSSGLQVFFRCAPSRRKLADVENARVLENSF
jgi:hypothetical protein